MSELAGEYKLACYQVIRALGQRDSLWLARESVTGERCVLRKLPPGAEGAYRALARVRHPGVVEIREVFACGGAVWAVEEFLPGRPLSQVLQEKGPLRGSACPLAGQLLAALAALQGHGIVHRDIKPENIMLDARGRVKLFDFHIARLYGEGKAGDTTVQGTRGYAAPEQYGFSQSDFRSDLYALGMTLQVLATGGRPGEGGARCPLRLRPLIRRCTQQDPNRRYPGAAQALAHRRRSAAAGLLLPLLLAPALLLLPTAKGPPKWEELCAATDPAKRILFTQEPWRYPAIVLLEDGGQAFSLALPAGGRAAVSLQKEGAGLALSIACPGGEEGRFQLDDPFAGRYAALGNPINTATADTAPHHELLLADLDQDGAQELLVVFTRRRLVQGAAKGVSVSLTEYSALWALCPKPGGGYTCSAPLYFPGCAPSLQGEGMLYDAATPSWYALREGAWLSLC